MTFLHVPIFPVGLRSSVWAALAIFGRDVATVLVRGILVLQDVFDAEVEALEARLGAGPLGEGAGLWLLRSGSLTHPVATRGQNVYSDSVHLKSEKKSEFNLKFIYFRIFCYCG